MKHQTNDKKAESHNVKPKRLHSSNKKYKFKTPSGKIVRLTNAQKRYADLKLADPERPLVQIAQEAYPNATYDTARQITAVNEKNQDIAIYSGEQVNKAIVTVSELLDDERSDIRLRASQDILDRQFGKAISKQMVQSTSVNYNVEVDDKLAQDFTEFLKNNTVK